MTKDIIINRALEEGLDDFVFVLQLLGIIDREHKKETGNYINFHVLKKQVSDLIIKLIENQFFTPHHLADTETGLIPWAGTTDELKIYLNKTFVANNKYTSYETIWFGDVITLLITNYGEKYILEKIKNGEHELELNYPED